MIGKAVSYRVSPEDEFPSFSVIKRVQLKGTGGMPELWGDVYDLRDGAVVKADDVMLISRTAWDLLAGLNDDELRVLIEKMEYVENDAKGLLKEAREHERAARSAQKRAKGLSEESEEVLAACRIRA